MILLGSGLSLARDNSFARQLRLLGREFSAAGRPCILAGVDSALQAPRCLRPGESDVPRLDAAAVGALAPNGVEAAILIGSPDQLALLAEHGAAAFLWAQFSRPPRPGSLGRARAVPLTGDTRVHLLAARCPAVGPVIPHGVDTRVLAPATAAARRAAREWLGLDERTLVLLSVGANTTRKRFDLLLAALALIPKATLVIKTDRASSPGGFDLEPQPRLRVIAEPLTDADMARLYNAADVYVHAAEWEGFGLPVVEAMACGLPVAAGAAPGPSATVPYPLVDRGEWVVEDGSGLFHVAPEALAAAVRTLAADPGLRARLGEAGRLRAVSCYDITRVAGRWLALLASSAGPGRDPAVESPP